MRTKGQLLSTEFIFGTVIFCLLLILVLISFSDANILINTKTEMKNDFDIAFSTSDFLVLSQGAPNNWQDNNIGSIYKIGLAKTKNEIDRNKLLKFIDLNSQYSSAKDLLGLQQYDLYVSFTNGQNANTLYEFGIYPDNNATVTTVTRYAVLDSNVIKINIKVWK